MFGFGGLSEVLFIMFLAMLIFGPEKLPEIGRMLAKGMAEVRKASNELKRTLNAELAATEQEQEARRNSQLGAVPPPPPSWSGGQTVPNLPAPAEAVVPPADEVPADAALGGAAPAGAAPADAAQADAAAEISEAAYLADWPEDLPSPPAALVDQGPAEPAGSAGSDGPAGSSGSAGPAGSDGSDGSAGSDGLDRSASATPAADSVSPSPAELAPSLLAHGERGGRDSA